ncbi:MAG TPA: glycine cleavage system protein GcvH [Gammaproteobacteria bacterium]|nr:glycine cleavage system protein GcvH [Gammaproteobacteria bacterium]
MSDIPNDLKYTRTHEWTRREDDEIVIVGITDHAQRLLGDVVFVELPEVGQEVKCGQESGVIESVKAASDLYAPMSGEIIEINEHLHTDPSRVNADPYHDGWLFRLKILDLGEWQDLLDAQEYLETIETE